MRLRSAAALSVLSVLFLGTVRGATLQTSPSRTAPSQVPPPRTSTPQMPLSEVRAGMVGTGITVFEGTRREEFAVKILGVLENVVGPRRSLILARLEGGRLAETGVMQGMSGSPVFVDGRLIGAVSYSLGAFSKEPIAGLTPIAEMTEATAMPTGRPATARAVHGLSRWPPSQADYVEALREAFARLTPEGFRAAGGRGLQGIDLSGSILNGGGAPGGAGFPTGATLRPIATPLTMAGYSGQTQALLSSVLTDLGFVPTSGGAPGASDADTAAAGQGARAPRQGSAAALAPGDAVGVSLVRGDLALGATGTVTHVDGNRVYAFGHPFFNLGPTEFPMTRAYVHALLPSLFTSSKLASIGEIVGTVQQDRATAIAGTLGPAPDLVPVKITLAPERGPSRSFSFEIVKDQMFTPLLAFASIVNTLQAYEREFGAATFTVRGQTTLKGHAPVAMEDVFTGDSPGIGAAAYVAGPLNILLRNDLAPVQIAGVDLTITSHEEPRTTTIERAWLDDETPRAGTTVPLHVLTRTYRGEERLRTVPVVIPSNATGELSVVVSDGTRLALQEQRERQPSQAQSVDQMIRIFNKARRNNRIYVRLTSSSPGAIIDGETLPALPPSVLAVIDAHRESGNVSRLSSAVLGEWEVPTDYAVVGQRTLSLSVRQP